MLKKLIVLPFLFLGITASADSYFVSDAMVVGVPKDEVSVVTELVKSNVSQIKGHSLSATQNAADYTLQPRLIKLGSAYMVTIDKVKQGKVVYSAQGKAGQLEDMDNVTQRVTRAAITEVEVKQDTRVGEVTERETTEGNKRKETVKHWYFGLGPAWSNINSDSMFNLDIAYAWDMNSGALKIMWDMNFGQSSTFSVIGLGGNYFFSDRTTTPFIGAEVGYGGATRRYSDSTGTNLFGSTAAVAGWVLGASAGYQFFRTSSVNLEAALHYSILMPVSTSPNIVNNPSVYGVRLGLYF